MATTWLFFQPQRLPLAGTDLDADTVLPLCDADSTRAALARLLPGIEWVGAGEGHVEVDGQWLEFDLGAGGEDGTLSLRCPLRADYRAFVQRLCDELGWLAFDETPLCYQPHRPPIPA